MTYCPDEFEDGGSALDSMEAAAEALSVGDITLARSELATAQQWASSAQLAFEALSCLNAGLRAEAAHRIRLYLRPKFGDALACEAQYVVAMGRACAFPGDRP